MHVHTNGSRGDPMDAVGLVPTFGVDQPAGQNLFSAQVRFGEWWAAERGSRLVTDQHHAAVVTLLAQGPGRDTSSHPRTENDHRFFGRGHNVNKLTPRMIGSLGTWVITSGAPSVMIDV